MHIVHAFALGRKLKREPQLLFVLIAVGVLAAGAAFLASKLFDNPSPEAPPQIVIYAPEDQARYGDQINASLLQPIDDGSDAQPLDELIPSNFVFRLTLNRPLTWPEEDAP